MTTMKAVSLSGLSEDHCRDQLVAMVRARLCQPNADVRIRETNVEVFGNPPGTAGAPPQWYFVGTAKDFASKPRSIFAITKDIIEHWPNAYYGAVPYLAAMTYLTTINDSYGEDSARSIVNYFLANAQTFQGEDARRLKKELKELLK
jgi:hypothetical protein